MALWRRRFQHGEQLGPQGGAMDRRLAGARRIGQTFKTLLSKPCPPFRNRIRPRAKPFGNLTLRLAVEAGKNDPHALDTLLGFRSAAADPFQLGSDFRTTR